MWLPLYGDVDHVTHDSSDSFHIEMLKSTYAVC